MIKILNGIRCHIHLTVPRAEGGGHEGLRYCGISVILILMYGIAVSSSLAVCSISSFVTLQAKRALNSKRFKGVYVWNAFQTHFKQFEMGFKLFETCFKRYAFKMQWNAFACVSNARPSVDLSTAKIISGTNIIIPQKSGMVIRL